MFMMLTNLEKLYADGNPKIKNTNDYSIAQ